MTELQGFELIEAVKVLCGLVVFGLFLVGVNWFRR